MKPFIRNWLRRRKTATNLVLAFSAAVLAGIWVNLLTTDISNIEKVAAEPLRAWVFRKYNLILLLAFASLWLQMRYNRWVEKVGTPAIRDFLEMTVMLLTEHARALGSQTMPHDIRGFFHVPARVKPGEKCRKEMCLIPVEYFCHQRPRDKGAIPMDRKTYQQWYVNVKAFRKKCFVSEQPDPSKRPSGDDLFINSPSQFPSASVMAYPVWRDQQNQQVGGVITFDSPKKLAELGWPDTTQRPAEETHKEFCDVLHFVSRCVAKINWALEET